MLVTKKYWFLNLFLVCVTRPADRLIFDGNFMSARTFWLIEVYFYQTSSKMLFIRKKKIVFNYYFLRKTKQFIWEILQSATHFICQTNFLISSKWDFFMQQLYYAFATSFYDKTRHFTCAN